MNKVEITIKVDIKPIETELSSTDTPEYASDGCFRLIVDGESSMDIDVLENGLLQTSYPALRDALSHYFSLQSKKKAIKKSQTWGSKYQVIKHDYEYRVDGEIGRFEFDVYDVKIDNRVVFEGINDFPLRTGKQWYQTCGFKEIALLNGVTERSYRQTTKGLNRSRRQEVGGTPSNTLHGRAESEGNKVIEFLEKKSERLLEDNEFTKEGLPLDNCQAVVQAKENLPTQLEPDTVKDALVSVGVDMQKKGLSNELIEDVNKKSLEKTYENPVDTVNIHIDKVGVKKQKEQRNKKGSNSTRDSIPNKRPSVQNTVARIEHEKKGFTLTGSNIFQVLLFVLGFLLNNRLISKRLLCLEEQERHLQDTIVSFFAWHPSISLILDWYHVVKKFKEELSLACKGREIRNRHLKELLPLLWFGLIDKASDYLREIPDSDLKNAGSIEKLLGYLERNHSFLPCYALRSKLELPNSSNPVERTNNLVTSRRQKHNGMSRSKEGSHALTALTAVAVNDAIQPWVKNHEIPFEFVEKEAA